MSRYSLKPLPEYSDIFEVAVGWDPGLDTYFVQVFGTPDASSEPDVRLWQGTSLREIVEVQALLAIAGNYAEISGEVSAILEWDRGNCPHDPMRPIGRIVAEILGHQTLRQ
ncbi:hypothetical protein [Sphingomonas sp. ERG5]|jgi:hypothetical protein|uniref:hypothetical protein n=1 Tax=Sphingomonas sp. ERG5 TaxID=1381597 RepID=UPI0003907044|nr:hypothetical protein [Sphingomonas sp. ERG5]AGU69317.1 hypothetical protein pCADAB1_062 [Sphingomonas sp. ERG5]